MADLTDFVNLDLAEAANGQGIHIYEHVTKVVRLPKNGYIFPLKQRYDYINTTLEGLRHAVIEPGDLPEFIIGLDIEAEGIEVSTESSGSGVLAGLLLQDLPSLHHQPITPLIISLRSTPSPHQMSIGPSTSAANDTGVMSMASILSPALPDPRAYVQRAGKDEPETTKGSNRYPGSWSCQAGSGC